MSSNSNGYKEISNVPVSQICATAQAQLGDRIIRGGVEYVYVYNAGNSQISKTFGAVCSGVSGYSVTVSSTAGDVAAGYAANATFATADYGWLAVRGFVNIEATANTGLTAGDSVILGVDGVSTAYDAASTSPINGKMQFTTASGGSGVALVNCFL